MADNENKKELNEAEEEGVTGGRGLAPLLKEDEMLAPHTKAKAPMSGFAPEITEAAKAKDKVVRPLPFPQDRR